MITYTKRNLSIIAVVLTIILFTLFHVIYSYFQNPQENNSKEENSFNQVYSKTIPNYSTELLNNNIKNKFLLASKQNETSLNINLEKNIESITISKKLVENSSNKTGINNANLNEKTQTQVLEENKNKTWRIQIPKINLNAHITEGTSSSVLLTSVGHFEQTSKWQGNVCLAAHNRGYKCNFFQNIKDLKIGDEIIYTTANNKKVYKVQTNKIILQTDWSYLQSTKDNRITLITCEENRKEYRRCIQAVEIASYKIKN